VTASLSLIITSDGLEKYFSDFTEILKASSSISWELEQEIAKLHGQEFLDKLKHWGQ
jgi:hypothetical protein